MSSVKITKESMGRLTTGEEIMRFRLENGSGAYCDIATLGGAIMRIVVPDNKGKLDDVIVGYYTIDSLEKWGGFFGKLVGRFANRIGNAEFSLNGESYTLAKNNGNNHLHGGPEGFHKKSGTQRLWVISCCLLPSAPTVKRVTPGI